MAHEDYEGTPTDPLALADRLAGARHWAEENQALLVLVGTGIAVIAFLRRS